MQTPETGQTGLNRHARRTAAPARDDRIIREPECRQITGLSRSTRWRLERAGKFPRRRKLSAAASGWLASEIAAWLAERAA
jgi:prophage regulatory protein